MDGEGAMDMDAALDDEEAIRVEQAEMQAEDDGMVVVDDQQPVPDDAEDEADAPLAAARGRRGGRMVVSDGDEEEEEEAAASEGHEQQMQGVFGEAESVAGESNGALGDADGRSQAGSEADYGQHSNRVHGVPQTISVTRADLMEAQDRQARMRGASAGPSGMSSNGDNESDVDVNDMFGRGNEGGGGGGGGGGARSWRDAMRPPPPPEPAHGQYEGWEEAKAFLQMGDPKHVRPLNLPQTHLWTRVNQEYLESLGEKMHCLRAEVINLPAWFFAVDAQYFKQWERRAVDGGGDGRIRNVAALCSLLWAGTSKGYSSGKHYDPDGGADTSGGGGMAPAENGGAGDEGAKRKGGARSHAEYVFQSDNKPDEVWPMFEMGYEEIYDEDWKAVIAVRIWKFTYHAAHSSSALINRVMSESQGLTASIKRNGDPNTRDRNMAAEMARLQQAACGPQDVASDFERLVDMQYRGIHTLSAYLAACKAYSGATSAHPGKPLVSNWDHWAAQSSAKSKPRGTSTGYGGLSPVAPEYLFSPMREEALWAGLADEDGRPMRPAAEQVAPDTYFTTDELADGVREMHFRLPDLQRDFFWVCNNRNVLTPFQVKLPRPLSGRVQPGRDMLDIVLSIVEKNEVPGISPRADPEEQCGDQEVAAVDAVEHEKFRSLATGRDEKQAEASERLQADLLPLDAMLRGYEPGSIDAANSGYASEKKDEFIVRVISETKRNAEHTNRLWTRAVNRWRSECQNSLSARAWDIDKDDAAALSALKRDKDMFASNFYAVMKQLGQYHLRMLASCFESSTKRKTIPRGHVAMYDGLRNALDAHGGSANMAFHHTGDAVNGGAQLTSYDRTVWAHLQDWLGHVFKEDCKVQGRDRRLADELYVHGQEVFTKQTWAVVCCSKRGTGKSMTAERLGAIHSPGIVQWNAGSSEKAGMNGNNSPNNGTILVYDETPQDITDANPTNRGEFWKQILSRREYELERTMAKKTSSGTDIHVTVKIVTAHDEVHQIMCNLGPNITVNGLPSESKIALIQRTTCIFARDQTYGGQPSEDAEFKQHMAEPEVQKRIAKFRLFTGLVSFVRLAIRDVDWLQPDLAYARLLWQEWDKMLVDDFNMSRPAPRRNAKRAENLITFCVMEAVARCYMFKQTASLYECGQRGPDGLGKQFDFGDLWDVLRTMQTPSRELIWFAWQYGLEYTVGTSMHGINVFTSICEKAGVSIGSCIRKSPCRASAQLGAQVDLPGAAEFQLPGFMDLPEGANAEDLRNLAQAMCRAREQRNEFRRMAVHMQGVEPLQAIQKVVDARNAREGRQGNDAIDYRTYSNALFPTLPGAAIFYKEQTLVRWLTGKRLDKSVNVDQGALSESDSTLGYRRQIRYHTRQHENGGPKSLDLAWMVVNDTTDRFKASPAAAHSIMTGTSAVDRCGMHKEGVADVIEQLMSPENTQRTTEMPYMPAHMSVAQAVTREGDDETGVTAITPRQHAFYMAGSVQYIAAAAAHAAVPAVQARDPNHAFSYTRCPEHVELDRLIARGRMPALLPMATTNVQQAPPVRHTVDNGMEVNAGRAFDHAMMIAEMSLTLQDMPGIMNLQEEFDSKREGPDGLTARGGEGTTPRSGMRKKLPYSYDLAQIYWAFKAGERLFASKRAQQIIDANAKLARDALPGRKFDANTVPELTMRYPGYQQHTAGGERSQAMCKLLSMKVGNTACAGKPAVLVETVSGRPIMNDSELHQQASAALGHDADEAELETYARLLAGTNYTYDVQGDVFDEATWQEHALRSLVHRGFTDADPNDVGVRIGVLDGESMLSLRCYERTVLQRANPGLPNELAIVPVERGSTYSWEAREGATFFAKAAVGIKRKVDANPSMSSTAPRHTQRR